MTNLTIESVYGTLDADKLKTLSDAIKEISIHLSQMDNHKAGIKDIVENVFDELKIPKKIINRIAKVYHKQTYASVIVEDNEFQALYESVVND